MLEFVEAKIFHARERPRRNAFTYSAPYIAFALGDMPSTCPALFSFNRFNIFSFYARDHGDGKTPLLPWIRNILADASLREADGDVLLFTLPRIFGYVFSPVSFWFCLDKEGGLRAVLSEVNNTFGERHCYLSFHDDHRPIVGSDVLQSEKVFYVSPFMKVDGHYHFRFAFAKKHVAIRIDHHDEHGLMLSTSMAGERRALSSALLLQSLMRFPLLSVKIIGLIHYQAAKLLLKGIRHTPKPAPPDAKVSR